MARDSNDTGHILRYKALIAAGCNLVLAALLSLASGFIPGFAEWYSQTIYPFLVATVGRIMGIFPLSAAEMIIMALPVIVAVDIIACRKRLRRVLVHAVVFVSVLLLLYSANCGVNYHRNSFVSAEEYEEISTDLAAESASEEGSEAAESDLLAEFCEYIITQLENNTDVTYPESRDLQTGAIIAMNGAGDEYPELRGFYPKPKVLTLTSGIFSAMGVTGIYSPFSIEANVNGEMPDMERPFTACHELSHLRGFMNEGEANYIGWLACIGSDDPSFRRSGWLVAWNHAASALRRQDPERFAGIVKNLPQDAAEELNSNYEFWRTHETKASEVQDKVNDAYLKSNGIEEGVASYDRLTVLMLAHYKKSIVNNEDLMHN